MEHAACPPDPNEERPLPNMVGQDPTRRVEARLRDGLAALYREDEEQALDLFLEVARSSPGNLRAHYLAALAAALLSDE
ncbi:hypothetical protein FJY71_05615, partial [candidate division WOR-3 bacterium]|nr:hypothetical protein [candidate division WOR-3 bacterium]